MDMLPLLSRRTTSSLQTWALASLLLLAPGLSQAQERAGVGGRGSVGVLQDPVPVALKQTVSLRIHPRSVDEATLLKDSLSSQQGVSDVKLSEDLRTVTCTYQGVPGDLSKLEAKSSGSLLSPARVVLALSRNPARPRCQTCGIDEHLRVAGGVATVVVKGSRADLYADLGLLDVRKLAEAADSAGYQVEVQSHAWWSVKIEGDAAKIPDAFSDLKGILKVERSGSEAKLLTLRAVSPEAIVSAALKAGLKATPTLLR
jgi:hypothetical protein